jgi:hypothetical protein
MRDNPIHTFFQVLGGNIPDQLSLGGYRWFEPPIVSATLPAGAMSERERPVTRSRFLPKKLTEASSEV